jgi:hypothetical protein
MTPTRRSSRRTAWTAAAVAGAIGLLPIGCVLVTPPPSDNLNFNFNANFNTNDNTGGNVNGNLNLNDNVPGDRPSVRLTVNNSQPFVGDQVDLTCSVLPGEISAGVIYNFEPTSARLVTNPTAGTAFFIVDQSDVGIELVFTCTGTNLAGTGEPSNSVSVFPSSPPFLP